ncbi:hypothetical protein JZ751_013654 [Albula glossodonta]|uniref:Coiled-coil domain-containing protein n=1 Tax=Albula glossodonta TaxID=121402 RepID=A0A8T2P1G5_9TELE|nr:hypothetical protein JZ751_013654 [Albula glossodonta]
MADFAIDQNNLPGVKDVCRDFAVLEDHCLAYSLQEQESTSLNVSLPVPVPTLALGNRKQTLQRFENHLASNVHRSQLMQKDLRVAKQMQEEEDVQARVRVQSLHRHIEQNDNEIAKELQVQLVRQAEQQWQQEQKDEAIARKLLEKEMKEEKKKKKKQGASSVEPYHDDRGGSPRGSRHAPPEPSWAGRSQRDPRAARGGLSRDGGASRSVFYADGEGARVARDPAVQRKEKPARPPPPQYRERVKDGALEGGGGVENNRDRDEHKADGQQEATCGISRVRPDEAGTELHHTWTSGFEESGPGRGGTAETQDLQDTWGEVPKMQQLTREDRPPSQQHPGDPGWKAGGYYDMKEVIQGVNQLDLQEQEWRDMEVARRIQEEELKSCQADMRVAQVAQDEEIARLLMEEERRGHKSGRDWEKRRPNGERRACVEEVVRPRLKDDSQSQRPKSQKPARPPPPAHSQSMELPRMRTPTRPASSYKGIPHRQ